MNKRARTDSKKLYKPDKRDLAIYYEYTRTTRTQEDIAKDYSLSRERIGAIVKKVSTFVYPEMRSKINSLRVVQTHRLEAIFEEAMFAWHRSQNDTVTTKNGKDGQEVTHKTSSGDPRHLAEAMKALADIRRIWGADEPEKVEVSGEIRAAGKSSAVYKTEIRSRLVQALEDIGPERN